MSTAPAKAIAASVAALALATLTACTVATDDPTQAGSATAAATADSAYTDAVAAYPRPLPSGYEFPTGLSGADAADKWWWCAEIDAAWEAYFTDGDEAAALNHLHAAAEVDPGSFGQFDRPAGPSVLPMDGKIDRSVHFIGTGVDSQYVEYTAHGCWAWAKSVGAEYPPQP